GVAGTLAAVRELPRIRRRDCLEPRGAPNATGRSCGVRAHPKSSNGRPRHCSPTPPIRLDLDGGRRGLPRHDRRFAHVAEIFKCTKAQGDGGCNYAARACAAETAGKGTRPGSPSASTSASSREKARVIDGIA